MSPVSHASPQLDPRAARTRERLRAALLAECALHALDEVTVSAVARRAGVGRATFYLHYQDIESLAVDACARVVGGAVEAVHAVAGAPDSNKPPRALTGFFVTASPNRDLYRRLLPAGGGGPLGSLLYRQISERAGLERKRLGMPASDIACSAVAATFTGLFADWLHGAIDEQPDALAGHVWRLVISIHQTA